MTARKLKKDLMDRMISLGAFIIKRGIIFSVQDHAKNTNFRSIAIYWCNSMDYAGARHSLIFTVEYHSILQLFDGT
jgi:hypothetical protein